MAEENESQEINFWVSSIIGFKSKKGLVQIQWDEKAAQITIRRCAKDCV